MSSTANGPVLVAVDFSADSEAALLWAAEYAANIGAGLTVVHVVHDLAEAPGHYHPPDNDALRPMEEQARVLLKEFLNKARNARPDLTALQNCQKILVTGLPASRILEIAKEEGASHLVVGSRGLTGLSQVLLGSKAQRVVQLSPIPVTVVKASPLHAETEQADQ